MPSGIREYARSRGVPRGTVSDAVYRGAIPLQEDGSIDAPLADEVWLPRYRPWLRRDIERAGQPDPEAVARTEAREREALRAAGMASEEAASFQAKLRRLLEG
jgi:hypothetical protein